MFWIHNTGPIGCLPYFVVFYPPKPEKKDPNGCLRSHNKVAKEFNRQLNETVSHLRLQLSEAAFTYVDIYAAKYSLISEANKLGKSINDPSTAVSTCKNVQLSLGIQLVMCLS